MLKNLVSFDKSATNNHRINQIKNKTTRYFGKY